jgi:predicted amidohydrolase
MASARSISVAQTVPVRGDVDANVAGHLRLVRAAAEERARVLVFPELSLTGYELNLAEELAFSEDDPRLAPLVEEASSRSLTLVVGAPVRIGSGLHIGAFILSPDRNVEIYTKHHLGAFSNDAGSGDEVPPPEATVFRPGHRNPLVSIDGEALAVAICADTGHPSHARAAAEQGATVYAAGVFVTPSALETETARLEAYAARHTLAVAMANYGGPSGGVESGGRSAIWSDTGERLATLEPGGSGIAVAVEGPLGWSGRSIVLGDT